MVCGNCPWSSDSLVMGTLLTCHWMFIWNAWSLHRAISLTQDFHTPHYTPPSAVACELHKTQI